VKDRFRADSPVENGKVRRRIALAEVAYLNGHRPFSLGGGNGSKCPYTVIGSS